MAFSLPLVRGCVGGRWRGRRGVDHQPRRPLAPHVRVDRSIATARTEVPATAPMRPLSRISYAPGTGKGLHISRRPSEQPVPRARVQPCRCTTPRTASRRPRAFTPVATSAAVPRDDACGGTAARIDCSWSLCGCQSAGALGSCARGNARSRAFLACAGPSRTGRRPESGSTVTVVSGKTSAGPSPRPSLPCSS